MPCCDDRLAAGKGTLRTLVHYSESPGEILSAMNQSAMIGRTKGGFTTCLVLCARAATRR